MVSRAIVRVHEAAHPVRVRIVEAHDGRRGVEPGERKQSVSSGKVEPGERRFGAACGVREGLGRGVEQQLRIVHGDDAHLVAEAEVGLLVAADPLGHRHGGRLHE
eukprot:scaffold123232_cov63-Phaeocystis_antarctica.AAC.1